MQYLIPILEMDPHRFIWPNFTAIKAGIFKRVTFSFFKIGAIFLVLGIIDEKESDWKFIEWEGVVAYFILVWHIYLFPSFLTL